MEVYDYAVANNVLLKAAIATEDFRRFVYSLKPKIAIEIGTYQGVTAAYLATLAEKVYTFDIKDYPARRKVWEDLGIADKIVFTKIEKMDDIRKVLENIKFDFCFIDGPVGEELIEGFKIVRKCGRVLFHNTRRVPRYEGIYTFTDKLRTTKVDGQTLYWHKRYDQKDKLNLGAGNVIENPEIYMNHDLFKHREEIEFTWDLNRTPWPWSDNWFSQITSKCVFEHLDIDLVKSVNECWRILKPGGTLYLKVPNAEDPIACWGDPTHRRPYTSSFTSCFDIKAEKSGNNFYTDRKWKIIRKGTAGTQNAAGIWSSICAEMEKVV